MQKKQLNTIATRNIPLSETTKRYHRTACRNDVQFNEEHNNELVIDIMSHHIIFTVAGERY